MATALWHLHQDASASARRGGTTCTFTSLIWNVWALECKSGEKCWELKAVEGFCLRPPLPLQRLLIFHRETWFDEIIRWSVLGRSIALQSHASARLHSAQQSCRIYPSPQTMVWCATGVLPVLPMLQKDAAVHLELVNIHLSTSFSSWSYLAVEGVLILLASIFYFSRFRGICVPLLLHLLKYLAWKINRQLYNICNNLLHYMLRTITATLTFSNSAIIVNMSCLCAWCSNRTALRPTCYLRGRCATTMTRMEKTPSAWPMTWARCQEGRFFLFDGLGLSVYPTNNLPDGPMVLYGSSILQMVSEPSEITCQDDASSKSAHLETQAMVYWMQEKEPEIILCDFVDFFLRMIWICSMHVLHTSWKSGELLKTLQEVVHTVHTIYFTEQLLWVSLRPWCRWRTDRNLLATLRKSWTDTLPRNGGCWSAAAARLTFKVFSLQSFASNRTTTMNRSLMWHWCDGYFLYQWFVFSTGFKVSWDDLLRMSVAPGEPYRLYGEAQQAERAGFRHGGLEVVKHLIWKNQWFKDQNLQVLRNIDNKKALLQTSLFFFSQISFELQTILISQKTTTQILSQSKKQPTQ